MISSAKNRLLGHYQCRPSMPLPHLRSLPSMKLSHPGMDADLLVDVAPAATFIKRFLAPHKGECCYKTTLMLVSRPISIKLTAHASAARIWLRRLAVAEDQKCLRDKCASELDLPKWIHERHCFMKEKSALASTGLFRTAAAPSTAGESSPVMTRTGILELRRRNR